MHILLQFPQSTAALCRILSPRSVRVNGEPVEGLERVVPERTAGWRHCGEGVLPAPVTLAGGRNVIRITSLGGSGLNFDDIRFILIK